MMSSNKKTKKEKRIILKEIKENPPIMKSGKITISIDITKNKEWCEKVTKSACFRPDIFLRNRDCDDCHLNEWCICPIKKFSKHYNKNK